MADTSHLFVYGTLQVPEIWNLVTGGFEAREERASLDGFAIRTVWGHTFPAIVRNEAEGVPGRVRFDLPPQVIDRLDAYEDDFYERNRVKVRLEGGAVVEAFAYEAPAEIAPQLLSHARWTLDWFLEEAFAEYWARLTGER